MNLRILPRNLPADLDEGWKSIITFRLIAGDGGWLASCPRFMAQRGPQVVDLKILMLVRLISETCSIADSS